MGEWGGRADTSVVVLLVAEKQVAAQVMWGWGGGARVISSSGASNATRDQSLPIMLRHII